MSWTETDAWRSFGGGSFSVSAGEGRIALSLDPRRNEIRFAVQGEGGTSALQHEYPVDDFADMAISTAILSEPVDIVAGQEISAARPGFDEKQRGLQLQRRRNSVTRRSPMRSTTTSTSTP